MAAKGQTEATCNPGNTNKIADEVGERTEDEKGNSTIGNAYVNFKDFQKAIEYHERDLKVSKEVGDRAGEGKAYGNLGCAYYSLCLLYTSPSPRDGLLSRMPSSA